VIFGAAILASIFALAGAPASTGFTCQPDVLIVNGAAAPNAVGVTRFGPPATIEVRPPGCAALLYAALSPRERVQVARLNPTVDLPALAGYGLLVDLHEAVHVATGSRNECAVELLAFGKLPNLVREVLPVAAQARALEDATAVDASFRQANGC
jgi:hypothetical protein